MWFLYKNESFYLFLLLSMVSWYVCQGEAPWFKSRNGNNKNVTAKNGIENLRLKCQVEGPSTMNYYWYKNGKLVNHTKNYRVKKFRYLKIKQVKLSDQASYRCEASNPYGAVSKTVRLFVLVSSNRTSNGKAPYFTKPVKMQNGKRRYSMQGGSVKFWCSANGIPKPTIQWYKDGNFIRPSSEITFNRDRSVMTIGYVTARSDSGRYSCRVSNKYGVISANYTLTVREKVRAKPVVRDIDNKTVTEGSDIVLECKALNKAESTFKLYKMVLYNNTTRRVDLTKKIVKEEYDWKTSWYRATWTLENVTIADQTTYICAATNVMGTTEKSFFLRVLSKGRAPLFKNIAAKNGCEDLRLKFHAEGPSTMNYYWYIFLLTCAFWC